MNQIIKNQKNLKRCLCPTCPSYNDCSHKKAELLFCSSATLKSTCNFKMNGCNCGICPIHEENNLKSGYYCINGPDDN